MTAFIGERVKTLYSTASIRKYACLLPGFSSPQFDGLIEWGWSDQTTIRWKADVVYQGLKKIRTCSGCQTCQTDSFAASGQANCNQFFRMCRYIDATFDIRRARKQMLVFQAFVEEIKMLTFYNASM